jgi:hypothetical protein
VVVFHLLLQDEQADAALAELVGEGEQVLEGPHGAGQPGDDEDVALAEVGQGLVESGAGRRACPTRCR